MEAFKLQNMNQMSFMVFIDIYFKEPFIKPNLIF